MPIITSASVYIHDKCQLLLTHDRLQYACCIRCAQHNSLINNMTTVVFPEAIEHNMHVL